MARRTIKIILGDSMFTKSLNDEKKDFIEYILFNYHFKSRISVWILNYLKSEPQLLELITFVDHEIANHPTIEIALSASDHIAIQYQDGHTILKDSNAIFQVVVQNNNPIDIQLHFSNDHKRDLRYDYLLLHQLLAGHQSDYFKDIYTINWSTFNLPSIVSILKAEIDMTLMLNDKDRFHYFSRMLNTILIHSL